MLLRRYYEEVEETVSEPDEGDTGEPEKESETTEPDEGDTKASKKSTPKSKKA